MAVSLRAYQSNEYETMNFNSDYTRGAHPKVLQRLAETNMEQTSGYGTDPYTVEAKRLILSACGIPEGQVHFLVGGTQTNATVIDGLLRRHEGVLATTEAHINVHESGAIEATGHKVLTLPHHAGKLLAKDVQSYIDRFWRDETHEHMVAPGMVYISLPTELGTVYTLSELEELSAVCRGAKIPLYIDGARLSYGLVSPGADVTLQDIARLADVFYIGGTKCGALFGEAVVTKRPELLPHFYPLIKQHGALLAKGRLLGVQFASLFTDGLYLDIARHAISMAMRLKAAMLAKGYQLYIDSPSNQQFFVLPNEEIDRLLGFASFELWGPRGETHTPIRLVTDWSTQAEDVDRFISML